jgi:hypothetical protein
VDWAVAEAMLRNAEAVRVKGDCEGREEEKEKEENDIATEEQLCVYVCMALVHTHSFQEK